MRYTSCAGQKVSYINENLNYNRGLDCVLQKVATKFRERSEKARWTFVAYETLIRHTNQCYGETAGYVWRRGSIALPGTHPMTRDERLRGQ